MATKKEIELQIEQNRLLKESNQLLSEQLKLNKESVEESDDFSNALKSQLKNIKLQLAEKNEVLSIDKRISKQANDAYAADRENIGTKNFANDLAKKQLSLKRDILVLDQKSNSFTEGDLETQYNINNSIQERIKQAKELDALYSSQLETAAEMSKDSGVRIFSGLEGIADKIGLKKFAPEIKEAGDAAKAAFLDPKFEKTPLLAGISSLGPSLRKALGPLAFVLALLDALKESDKVVSDMAKNLNKSYQEAAQLKIELTSAANASGNIFVTSAKLAETLLSINSSLGTNVKLSDEMLVQFTEMREMAGFTNEELQGIAAISLTTGESMNDITGEFMAQAKISSIQNGVLLNEKELLKGIKDVSAATTLSLGKNPGLIADAVATAKALGMELSKVDAIAGSLLDFESSISAELDAEMLLGRDINLEKARQAALDNNLATVAKELSEQAGTSAEFGAMNRIQQEAIAKAVGMGRDDLAQTLFVQEQLAGATGDEAAEQEKLLNNKIAQVGLAQAQAIYAKEGIEGLRQQAGMADRMKASMDKLNEVFVSLVEPLMPVLDIFVSILDLVGLIVQALKPLFDFASFLGSGLNDLLRSGGSLLTGGEADFSNVNAAGKRLASDNYLGQFLGGEGGGYYSDMGSELMAKGGIVTKPTRAIIGEAGPEAVVPLSKELKVDNSKMEKSLEEIASLLSKQSFSPVGLYEIQ